MKSRNQHPAKLQQQQHQPEEKTNMKIIQIEVTLKKLKKMSLKGKVTVLRKMILKIVERMRVLMMELLMSQRSFMKHGVNFLHPLM